MNNTLLPQPPDTELDNWQKTDRYCIIMDQDSGFDTSGIGVVYKAALFSVLYFYSVHALFCTVERFYNFVTK